MIGQRVRSPLRWLWVLTSSLVLFLLAGAFDFIWIGLAIPFVAAALLLAPPIGIFRHDETPVLRTGVSLVAQEMELRGPSPPGSRRFLLVLVNDGEVRAAGFRLRILVPAAIWPRGTHASPLARLHVGELGRHWFVENVYDDTSVTFRAGPAADAGSVACDAGATIDLAELTLVNLVHFDRGEIEYQINGGTVRTVLGRIVLPAAT